MLCWVCLTCLVRAQPPFEENLSVTLEGQFAVNRVQTGSEFFPLTLSSREQQRVPLIWQQAPVFEVICTNGKGWSVTLFGPALLPGPRGVGLPIEYQSGSGQIISLESSDPVSAMDANQGGSLATGVKTVSVPLQTFGRYRYQVGNFWVTRLPPDAPAGRYGGANLLVSTFANTP